MRALRLILVVLAAAVIGALAMHRLDTLVPDDPTQVPEIDLDVATTPSPDLTTTTEVPPPTSVPPASTVVPRPVDPTPDDDDDDDEVDDEIDDDEVDDEVDDG